MSGVLNRWVKMKTFGGMTALVGLVSLVSTGAVYAQSNAPTSPSAATAPQTAAPSNTAQRTYVPVFPETTPYPVDVDRVKERAEQLPAVRLDDQQLRFYVLVVAKEPDFVERFAKDYDFRNGPTRRGAAMTNQEFLKMVTPKELNELLGGTSSGAFALLQVALTNAAGQALIKKGLQEIHDARNEREIQAIRNQINRELAALLGKDQQ